MLKGTIPMHTTGTLTPHARRGHRPDLASPAAPPTAWALPDRNGDPWGSEFGSSPVGGGWGKGGLFACSFAYGLDEAGGEVAHTVVAGPVVVNAALPAPIRVLLQHLRAGAGSGASAAIRAPLPDPLPKPHSQ